MKSIKIAAFAVLAAVLLVGCGEQSVSETSGSSVESTTSSSSSVESSSEPSSISGGQSSSSSEVADNQEILKSSQSSQGDSSTSDTSIDVSTSEPTPDTHEPTSSSGDNTSTPTTSKPTSSSSQPNTSTPTSPYWNPDAPGNTPGKYKDSYIDVDGNLHCKYENMPRDSYGYPVESYYTETGMHVLTKAEKDADVEETKRIDQGGLPNVPEINWDNW